MSDPAAPLRIPPRALLAGVVRALQEQVLPHLDSKQTRGQLWAAIDVLRNLAERVEPAHAPLEAEVRSIEEVLRALRQSALPSAAGLAAAIDGGLAAAPPAPVGARVVALRALLCDTMERLDALPPEIADALRPLLAPHLAGQTVRELASFQGSLLEEISKG